MFSAQIKLLMQIAKLTFFLQNQNSYFTYDVTDHLYLEPVLTRKKFVTNKSLISKRQIIFHSKAENPTIMNQNSARETETCTIQCIRAADGWCTASKQQVDINIYTYLQLTQFRSGKHRRKQHINTPITCAIIMYY